MMALDSLQRPLVFGEVLFDRFTEEASGQVTEVLGGAPFNVAWHLHAFAQTPDQGPQQPQGRLPRLISRVGRDPLGTRILQAMAEQDMDSSLVQQDATHPTGTVEVSLQRGEPSYDIVAERAYDFIDSALLPKAAPGTLLYHGTLAARHRVSAAALQQLRDSGELAVFVDVNLRAPWWTPEQVSSLIEGATYIKLNADELAILAPPGHSLEARAQALIASKGLTATFITLGAEGALAVSANGEYLRLGPPRVERFVDAVGAGDGFASVLILGLLHDWPLQQTLERAQTFASAIVGQRGATSRDPAFYRAFSEQWSQP
ncbi:PfkB family carbohydrate kinase [Thiorhodovibrio frisius]|uniref:Sugar kinase, ribokinase n=1 Tax=Thiorhodovibrio frisius TaxID=631362 RepID=H8Z6L5_9GAMM|nr:PfkB family carbohydrate kinase [Thiorhodovibrio frisius]EIC19713.1 sugar kinase, ribokinase [Thiorhodovibrio frisius]WPL20319.1 2-dehydro-3-deoxygluconokinase [Thiorhodovibrio frisius]